MMDGLGKWAYKNMDLVEAKEQVEQLMRLCENPGVEALAIVMQSEREDYAEAIRVVLEYLP